MPSVTASTIPGRQRNQHSEKQGPGKKVPTSSMEKCAIRPLMSADFQKLDQVAKILAAELGRVREKERQKIAEDFHDQIGQNLVLAKMKLDALNSSLGNKHWHSLRESPTSSVIRFKILGL